MKSVKECAQVENYLRHQIADHDGRYLLLRRADSLGLPEIMHFRTDGQVDFLEVIKPNCEDQHDSISILQSGPGYTCRYCYWIDSTADVDQYFEAIYPRLKSKQSPFMADSSVLQGLASP